jgi:alcohol dehydrogenase class IV
MWFFRSPEIIFGEDSLSFLKDLNINRCLIVSDSFIVKGRLLDKLLRNLPASAKRMVIGDISPEPTFREMTSRIDEIRNFNPDYVIGFGGGSSMDTSKILFALNERPDLDVYDITPLVPLGLRKKSKLIAIPTTSGTGSECSWAAVLSEEGEKRKSELASPEILPDYAVLDPDLVTSLPPEQTKNTAADAITHAIEGYVSAWNNPFSDAMSEKALELISMNIETVLKSPDNIDARNSVHIGASMAGLSFSNSQIGLAHALGHSLGAYYKLAHGKTVAIFLPSVIDFNYSVSSRKFDRLNGTIPEKYRKNKFSDSIRSLFRSMGVENSIEECGIDRRSFDENLEGLVSLASESTGCITNPRESGTSDIRDLFLKCYPRAR